MTAASMQAVGARGWSMLTAAERRLGVRELDAAVEVLANTGGDRRALQVIATVAASQLVLGPAGAWSLSVEHPQHATRAAIAGSRPTYSLDGVDEDAEWTAGVFRPMPLADGMRVLADPEGGPTQLERRRVQLADRRRREAETIARRDQEAQERDAARAAFEATNRTRLELWRKLPREVQALHLVADAHPALAPALHMLATLVGQSSKVSLDLPATFKPELAGR